MKQADKRTLWIIARSLPVHIGGGMEHIAKSTIEGLAHSGWQVVTVTNRLPADPGFPESVSIAELDAPPGVHSGRFRRACVTWARAQTSKPAAIISVSSAGSSIARLMPNVPSIYQCHGTRYTEALSKLLAGDPRGLINVWRYFFREKIDLRGFDRYVPIGPAIEKTLRSRAYPMVPPEKIHLIVNGIDMVRIRKVMGENRATIRREFDISPDAKLIVAASRLVRSKGVFQLIRAFPRLQDKKNAVLLIAGDGPHRSALEKLVASESISGVRLLGAQPRDQVHRLMRCADCVAQISLAAEGLGLVALEALSLGCPVLLSNHILVPAVPGHGGIHHTDPRNVDAIAASIDSILSSTKQDNALATAAQEQYSLTRMIDRYDALLEELIR